VRAGDALCFVFLICCEEVGSINGFHPFTENVDPHSDRNPPPL